MKCSNISLDQVRSIVVLVLFFFFFLNTFCFPSSSFTSECIWCECTASFSSLLLFFFGTQTHLFKMIERIKSLTTSVKSKWHIVSTELRSMSIGDTTIMNDNLLCILLFDYSQTKIGRKFSSWALHTEMDTTCDRLCDEEWRVMISSMILFWWQWILKNDRDDSFLLQRFPCDWTTQAHSFYAGPCQDNSFNLPLTATDDASLNDSECVSDGSRSLFGCRLGVKIAGAQLYIPKHASNDVKIRILFVEEFPPNAIRTHVIDLCFIDQLGSSLDEIVICSYRHPLKKPSNDTYLQILDVHTLVAVGSNIHTLLISGILFNVIHMTHLSLFLLSSKCWTTSISFVETLIDCPRW